MDLNGDNDPTRNGGVGANDKNINFADIAMNSMGNIAEMAASLPGVTLIPGTDGGAAGFSILGLGADQNVTTLNGLSFDGSSLPADAVQSARVSTNPYNPSQGGFSGAQVSLRLKSGSNIVMESVGSTQSPGSLIFTDPAGQALGAQQTNTGRYNISRSGPIQYDKTYYAASFQLTRTASLLKSLLNTDPLGLERLGISSDSVNNDLVGVLNSDGIPQTVSGLNDKIIDAFTSSLNFDLNPTGAQNYTVGITGGATRTTGAEHLEYVSRAPVEWGYLQRVQRQRRDADVVVHRRRLRQRRQLRRAIQQQQLVAVSLPPRRVRSSELGVPRRYQRHQVVCGGRQLGAPHQANQLHPPG